MKLAFLCRDKEVVKTVKISRYHLIFLIDLLQIDQNSVNYLKAIVIHDTNTLVGACSVYGEEALQICATA